MNSEKGLEDRTEVPHDQESIILAPIRTGIDGNKSQKPSGRITLEVAVRYPESGRVWTLNTAGTTNPMQALLPMALEGGGELVARYPRDSHWQLLTFLGS